MLKFWHGSYVKIPSYSHFKKILKPRPNPPRWVILILMVNIFLFVKEGCWEGGMSVWVSPAHLSGSCVINIVTTVALTQPSLAAVVREVEAGLCALWALDWAPHGWALSLLSLKLRVRTDNSAASGAPWWDLEASDVPYLFPSPCGNPQTLLET